MASRDSSKYAEWMWKSNINPFSDEEPEEWCNYDEEESQVIEEAWKKKKNRVYLQNYYIDFDLGLQISIRNPTKRRPINRVVHDKESWVKREGKLGEGGFGKVYKGTYRNTQEVAYKVTRTQLSSAAQSETNILKTLHHPNIVQYIDVIHTSQHTLLIMELIDGGTLYHYITDTTYSPTYWRTSRNIMIDVAYALSYLHEKNVVHADLKSDNILRRRNGSAVLSDFGLSVIINDFDAYDNDSNRGAIRWLAPELCFADPEKCSFQSDVWAFGCVLLEIISKDVPWLAYFGRHQQLMKALADERNGPKFQEHCREQRAPEKFIRLLCACCAWSKHNRPNFEKIIKDLRTMSDVDLEFPKKNYSIKTSALMDHSDKYTDPRNRCQTAPINHNYKRQNQLAKQALYSSDEEDEDSIDTINPNWKDSPQLKAGVSVKMDESRKKPSKNFQDSADNWSSDF